MVVVSIVRLRKFEFGMRTRIPSAHAKRRTLSGPLLK